MIHVSNINRRILETIEKSAFPDEVKELLRTLLTIELKHFGDRNPRYAEDYDRNIKRLAKFKEPEEDK